MHGDIDTVVAEGTSLRLVVTDAEDQEHSHHERMVPVRKTMWDGCFAEVDLLKKAVPGYG